MCAMLEHKAHKVFNLKDTVLAEFQQVTQNCEKFGRNISFSIDPVGMINAFFSGINNWIHASSISEVCEQLDDLAHLLKGIKAVEQVFSVNQVRLVQAMADYINGTEILYETNPIDLLLWLSLDGLQEALLAVVMAPGDLAQRHFPAWLLPPTEAVRALEAMDTFALKNEQQSALSSPMDLH